MALTTEQKQLIRQLHGEGYWSRTLKDGNNQPYRFGSEEILEAVAAIPDNTMKTYLGTYLTALKTQLQGQATASVTIAANRTAQLADIDIQLAALNS